MNSVWDDKGGQKLVILEFVMQLLALATSLKCTKGSERRLNVFLNWQATPWDALRRRDRADFKNGEEIRIRNDVNMSIANVWEKCSLSSSWKRLRGIL